MAAASAFYSREPTAEELAAFGMTADDFDDEVIEVWPDCWPAFCVFQGCATQWRTGMAGPTGLDYNVLPWLMKIHGIEDEAAALKDIRLMERVALAKIHKSQEVA
ncbi:DUF1799 domain-containing protein [Klebsiella aerogenes]|uniref:DUF1799 domain-containing protein n=1 Tax=Klebsiella aerogenes TaxID=548 RepID=UPI001E5F38F4|nr:DUF1799 domain-containing protein [Klebsiella aerogenes]